MLIIGVDYHPSFQQISFLDQETGECGDRRLNHSDGEAERFYKELKERGVSVRVGIGGHRIFPLVRAVTGGVGFRGMDWRCGGDQEKARPEAEDRPRGRPTPVAVASGESLSAHLGTESRESRSTTTTLAPASAGADAHADHESAAGRGHERRLARKKKLCSEKGRALLEKLSLAPWASGAGKNYWSCWTGWIPRLRS